MGDSVEVTVDNPELGAALIATLTERHRDVVLLLGRDGLTYKRAAMQMLNQQVRVREGVPPLYLSYHTVRRYANEIRDMVGLAHLSPLRAMWVLYQQNREAFEEVA